MIFKQRHREAGKITDTMQKAHLLRFRCVLPRPGRAFSFLEEGSLCILKRR